MDQYFAQFAEFGTDDLRELRNRYNYMIHSSNVSAIANLTEFHDHRNDAYDKSHHFAWHGAHLAMIEFCKVATARIADELERRK